MKAIIFSAVVGRRLQAVTQGKAKWLVDIGGRTLLSRLVE
jgi:choline kinase